MSTPDASPEGRSAWLKPRPRLLYVVLGVFIIWLVALNVLNLVTGNG
jgi:hypothetical protein